ncbi:hypothetical protein D1BOALGB6SA_8348 [Olavius sp. associated proteobacterium Delta 1]|nr:hypothetical protein D1BOALGB6SA_8348 [Olavius sp. associated proteobacterium Delta 1]
MKIQLLENSVLSDLANEIFGDLHDSTDIMIETLRSELTARVVSNRLALCKRVKDSIAPIEAVELESILGQLEILEINGDATRGPGGKVAAAPLRAVKTGPNRYNIYGTLPSADLLGKMPIETIDKSAASRSVIIKDESHEQFVRTVSEMAGKVLSPEQWAGLEKSEPAGAEWIKKLNQWLNQGGKEPGFIRIEFPEAWRVYRPEQQKDSQSKRWKKQVGDGEDRLWRCRSVYGRWLYVWTDGREPDISSQIKLSADNALRTMYSLDCNSQLPLKFNFEESDHDVHMAVNAMVPIAEYRYLTTIGQRLESSGLPFQYRFQLDTWPAVKGMLSERLQVIF